MGALENIVSWLRKAWEFLHKEVPQWVKDLITEIGKILVRILGEVAETYITSIERKIIEMSGTNYSNEEKFNAVWSFAKTLLPKLSESDLDTLVQNLFKRLKEMGISIRLRH